MMKTMKTQLGFFFAGCPAFPAKSGTSSAVFHPPGIQGVRKGRDGLAHREPSDEDTLP
jgi:hypothetical protein